jgi:L-iditol 2-dehydrogenase
MTASPATAVDTPVEVRDTMRAAVLSKPGEIRIEQRPTPTPGPDEVLVEVAAVGVCGSDVHYYEHGRIGDFVVESPLVLGHEVSGRIVSVGAQVPRERIGQRVALEPGRSCRRCDQCVAGRYNLCRFMQFYGTPPVDGALADYVLAPSDLAFEIPASMTQETAALLEPLSVGIWACEKAGVTAGSSVLIAGAGPIGLVNVQVARALGATRIVVTDINRERLEVAAGLGATRTVLAGQQPGGPDFDCFIDCSGAAPAIDAGVRAVRPAGTVVLVGMGADVLTVPFGVVQQKELKLTGTFRYAHTWPTAIAMAEAGYVDLDALITSRFSLADTEKALQATSQPGQIKAVIVP